MNDARQNGTADGSRTRALAGFAAGLRVRDLPVDIVQRAQACLLYGLSVGIASTSAEAPRLAAGATAIDGRADQGGATRWLDGASVPVGAAAFCNAVLMHARVQEDAHPTGHVGVVVVPSALAIAERTAASGAELLAALVAGYEVALRIGRDHASDTSDRGFRTTSLYGVFGAAAASARLFGLGETAMLRAMSLAANLAGGLREFVIAGTDEYPMHAGFAARNGIVSANLARLGARAAATSVEGPAGFYRAYGEANRDYAARLAQDLGREFELSHVTYKPYPTCQFNRGVIGGVLALRDRLTSPLQALEIHLHPFEAEFVGMRYAGPFSEFAQTFMSAPFCAALAWCSGGVSYADMHVYDRRDVLDAIARIDVVADPSRPRYQPLLRARGGGEADPWTQWEEDRSGGECYALTWASAVEVAATFGREAGVAHRTVQALIAAVEALPSASGTTELMQALRTCVAASNDTQETPHDQPRKTTA